jgi:diguanylate cyclase (GGDEF)-like protein
MIQQKADQQKISFLVITELGLILFAMIGFSFAVVYSMANLQANIQSAYLHPTVVNNAVLEAYTNLSHLHNHMLQIVSSKGLNLDDDMDDALFDLDKNLRNNFKTIKSEFTGDTEKTQKVDRLLNDWTNIRLQMIDLIRHDHRDQAFKLATNGGIQIYRQLEGTMGQIVSSSQKHTDTLIVEANENSARIIHLVWWLLGGFILTSIISGVLVIRKISSILAHSRQADQKLYESEERMKLALSGAEVGTWDLDIITGKLDLDSQWGGILNYISEDEKPSTYSEWVLLVHASDRDRVLKTMQDHVEGLSFEYKAEYRIHARTGKYRWVIGHGKAVQRDQNGKALRVVGITRDITLQKEAEKTIWKLAHTDSLTGLPNRALFYDRLGQSIAQSKRQGKKLALLFIDLDDFKLVNDKFGHDTGDAVLQEVAERMRQAIRNENTVARTGGDEFILILTDIESAENAAVVAKKIILSLSDPFVVHEHTCQIGSSIGISVFPDDSEEIEKLVTDADNAMYKAKVAGKNNYQFFTTPRDRSVN